MLLSCGSHISIHTPAKGVTLKKDIRDELMFHFNPHSREGSDQIAKRVAHVQHNFNPHSREGSDDPSFTFKISLMISIHTPAKGVTSIEMLLSCGSHISIHTPAKGVTLKKDIRDELMFHFNPHSREGSDLGHLTEKDLKEDFNPHSREGSDKAEAVKAVQTEDFNPHSREGSDVVPVCSLCHIANNFNPHSREGSD